jgi:hypothetical protein
MAAKWLQELVSVITQSGICLAIKGVMLTYLQEVKGRNLVRGEVKRRYGHGQYKVPYAIIKTT